MFEGIRGVVFLLIPSSMEGSLRSAGPPGRGCHRGWADMGTTVTPGLG